MKLYIFDSGDPSVGMTSQEWAVEVPFEKENLDADDMESFKQDMVKLYSDFGDGKVSGMYDFEVEAQEEYERRNEM